MFYDGAQQMYQRALAGKEKAWGPEHTSTLDTVNNLGNLYADQGKLKEAEQMYQRALGGYEKNFARGQIKTTVPMLNILENFGYLYKLTARREKALELYWRALDSAELMFGSSSQRYIEIDALIAELV